MAQPQQSAGGRPQDVTIALPAPTAWPFFMALGVALIFAGLLTSPVISLLGAVLYISGGVGWFREVLPREHRELVTVKLAPPVELVSRREVVQLKIPHRVPRAWLPLKIYPISAGVKGGLAGAVAMGFLAMLYGVLSHGSVWYPINLLAGSLYAPSAMPTVEEMLHFRLGWFLFALALHIATSLLVGLLYGAMLPMLPNHPILLGGVTVPLIWTGLLYHIIGFVNPLLDERINWWWFALSQVGFGVVAGLIVVRRNQVWTSENLPLALRAGIEAQGIPRKSEDAQR